ncbi:TRAP transporter large permease subunit [Ammoniphilus sp. 3BR4]|uniref:TRAP transporter large permease n=1 Tax=Ammoniphilus sp. 3BR4 TaxID=3158265 RepID=UPI003467CC1D
MEWPVVLTMIFGSMAFLLLMGVPVAITFLLIDIVGVYLLWGGSIGLKQLILNIFESVSVFSLLPIPMFLFMGEIMFRTGLGLRVFDTLAKWMGKVPGRLSLMSVGSGTLFGILCGSSVASTALLGSLLVPEMNKRGYKNSMSVGPILGSAGLAILIPPTALGVLLASLGGFPVGDFLVAIILPGLILALSYVLYIIIRCMLQPDLAPVYEVEQYSLKEKWIDTLKYIVPLGFILFLVLGVIILGMATPTQSAVLGAVGSLVLAACYGQLNLKILKESLEGTLRVTGMIFLIMAGSMAFSQILSFTGATQGILNTVKALDLSAIPMLISIQAILILLGCFMEPLSIMMMTLPILMPIAQLYEFNPLWYGAIILLNMQMATATPPFGMDLFAMKAVAPNLKMGEIYRSVLPFLGLNLLVMAMMIIFPWITLWLPGLMR